MKTNHNQIIFAREYRSYSQTELASKIKGLSQSKLSKIEKGIEEVSDDQLEKLSEVLNFPIDFFYLNIQNKISNANFRKKRISQTKKNELERKIKIYGHLVDSMTLSEIELPSLNFPMVDLTDGFTPQSVAKQIRRMFNLGDKPVRDIYALLEDNGIIVIEDSQEINEFDGVSYITDNGAFVIIINANMPNDRKRFTLAHELGHLIMHNVEIGKYLIDDERDLEKEANEFASEFLMPEDGVRAQLNNLKLSELFGLKQYWLTSMASLLYRAKSLNCIDANKAQFMNIELSRKGYRKNEPGVVPIDKPDLFIKSFRMFIDVLQYSMSDMSKLFSIPVDDIEMLFSLKPTPNKRVSLLYS